jgi:hypothetical protein
VYCRSRRVPQDDAPLGSRPTAQRDYRSGRPTLRHHDSMAAASKRSPVFKHSISVGARRDDDVPADNLYADSSGSPHYVTSPAC